MSKLNRSFLIRPLEPLYFGGPSSFGAGEQHVGESGFPPSPFAFQGLIRSHLLRSVRQPVLDLNDWSESAIIKRRQLVGQPDALPDGWQIGGPLPACVESRKDEFDLEEDLVCPWVPVPRFLLANDPAPLFARPIVSDHQGMNDLNVELPNQKSNQRQLLLLGRPEENALSPLSGWIGPENFYSALAGEGQFTWQASGYAGQLPPFIGNEYQPGVAIDPGTGTAAPGKLYMLKTLRFKANAGFVGWFSGDTDPSIPSDPFSTGAAGAGRKGRVACFEAVDKFHPAWEKVAAGHHLPGQVYPEDSFWLVAVTPVRLNHPTDLNVNQYLPADVTLEVRGALTGPPVTVGGYQMASGKSRLNRPYLPAGSTWLIQLKGNDPKKLAKVIHSLNNSHKLGPSGESKFGFGRTFVGIGPQIKETE